MPLYRYRDEISGVVIDVIRTFEEFKTPPTEEEIALDQKTEVTDPTPERRWVRVLDPNIRMLRGAHWNGAKGYWGKV